MRIIVLFIIAVPCLMAFRTLALFRDWIILRVWASQGAPADFKPVLNDPPPPGASLEATIRQAFHKFCMSLLETTAAACFATAAAATVVAVMGR